MSSATLVSAQEYLSTNYRPDRELVDGFLLERNGSEYDHSNLQRALIVWMGSRQRASKVRGLPEQRIGVAANRFRIPDICVVSRDQRIEPVFTAPPLLCIEILSKDDTLRSMQDRIDDYLAFGVANIWVLDPVSRRAWVCTHAGMQTADEVLRTNGGEVLIPLGELFADLD